MITDIIVGEQHNQLPSSTTTTENFEDHHNISHLETKHNNHQTPNIHLKQLFFIQIKDNKRLILIRGIVVNILHTNTIKNEEWPNMITYCKI